MMTSTTAARRSRSGSRALAAGAIAVVALGACGDDDTTSVSSTAQTTTPTTLAVEATVAGDGTPEIRITGAWARSSPMMVTAGAAYMVISNTGDTDDALLSVTVDESVAASAELHATLAAGSRAAETPPSHAPSTNATDAAPMMRMVAVERIGVPSGATVTLEPGGLHVMLLDLAQPLAAGTEIELLLTFAVSGELPVTAVVGDGAS